MIISARGWRRGATRKGLHRPTFHSKRQCLFLFRSTPMLNLILAKSKEKRFIFSCAHPILIRPRPRKCELLAIVLGVTNNCSWLWICFDAAMVSASGRCLNVASPLPLMGLMLRFTCPKTQGAPIVIVRRRRRRQRCCFGSVRKTFVLNKPWYVNMWSVGGRVVDSPPASSALTMVDGGWIEYCSEFGYSTGDDAILIPDHVYGTAAVWIVWTDYCFFFFWPPTPPV